MILCSVGILQARPESFRTENNGHRQGSFLSWWDVPQLFCPTCLMQRIVHAEWYAFWVTDRMIKPASKAHWDSWVCTTGWTPVESDQLCHCVSHESNKQAWQGRFAGPEVISSRSEDSWARAYWKHTLFGSVWTLRGSPKSSVKACNQSSGEITTSFSLLHTICNWRTSCTVSKCITMRSKARSGRSKNSTMTCDFGLPRASMRLGVDSKSLLSGESETIRLKSEGCQRNEGLWKTEISHIFGSVGGPSPMGAAMNALTLTRRVEFVPSPPSCAAEPAVKITRFFKLN